MRSYYNDFPSHRGLWQVFVKVRWYWLTIGPPQPEAGARDEVMKLKAEGRLEQPHCVPL